MIQFHETRMGQIFFEGTMPKINHNLEDLTKAVSTLTEQVAALTKEVEALRKEQNHENG